MNRKVVIAILTIIILLLYSGWAFFYSPPGIQIIHFSPSSKECSVYQKNTKYCIHLAKQGTNNGVVYFLHGRNLDEHIWNDDSFYTALIQKYWEENQRRPPAIVTVSFGSTWLLTKAGASAKSGLLDKLVKEFIPFVEKGLNIIPSYRVIMGESMGGLNSLIVGLNYPKTFDRIASLCPPIYEISPFDSFPVIWNTINSTGADPKTILGVILLAREYVKDSSEWDSINPLTLLNQLDSKFSNKIYLSAPLYDKYGLFSGASEFAKRSSKRGLDLQWRPIYGGHCAIDINSVSEFLL